MGFFCILNMNTNYKIYVKKVKKDNYDKQKKFAVTL